MKKIYSIALCLLSAVSFAQQTISFENSAGFITGNIHGQGTWISTPTGDIPPNVLNQIITADAASDGNNSLKIVKENTYGTQSVPIIGAFDNLSVPLAYNNFTVSFDINMSQLNGSIFSFQGVSSAEEKYTVRLDFDNTGVIKVLKMVSGIPVMEPTATVWLPNLWYKLTVMGTAADIKYYLNGILIHTATAPELMNIDQLRFVHDNADGIAYIDNLKIHTETVLSSADIAVNKNNISVYPNPVSDILYIKSKKNIKNVEIFDNTGRKVNVFPDKDKMNVKNLIPGVYIINIETNEGKTTQKLIKK